MCIYEVSCDASSMKKSIFAIYGKKMKSLIRNLNSCEQ
jgi:hypothetical protein